MKKENKNVKRGFSAIKSVYEKPLLKFYELEIEGAVMDTISGGAPDYEKTEPWQ